MPPAPRKALDPSRAASGPDFTTAYGEADARAAISETIAVPEVNNPPVVDLDSVAPGSDSTASFTEGNSAVLLAPSGTVVDPDSPDFDGGTLTVQFTSGSQAEDMLVVVGLDPDAGGQIFNGNGDVIAVVSGGDSPSNPLVVTFTSFAGASDVQSVLRQIGYVDYSNSLSAADRTISFTLTDGDGGTSTPATATVHVSTVDTPPVAGDDLATTDEASTVVIAVLANDSDPDGPPPSVTTVGGQAISAGQTVTISSGAKVTLNANGTLTYDPNHQFDTLTSTSSGETGAVNTSAFDTFTYGLAGGTTATVGVTVNGIASAQDHLNGDGSDNTITGTGNADYFDLSQGGDDTASGLGGDDAFFFGGAFTGADQVDGGAGTNDQIGLQGNYTGPNSLVLGASTIANIEAIVLLGNFSYQITTNDGNVAAGGVLKVQATQLGAGNSLVFNGSAETDGSFLVFGSNGNDTLTGGQGDDGFYFGPGQYTAADTVNGGAGTNDQLGLDGDYTLTLGSNVTNVEVVVLLPGPAGTPNHFNVNTSDVFVGAGQTMTIFGLQTSTGFTFNGSGEHDGAFRVYGGTGNDVITGSTDNDWIFGGDGTDTLTGGGGNDIFYYDALSQSNPAGRDGIQDFNTGDKMDVSGIDAITGGGDDAFTFIGAGAFTNHAGELRAATGGGGIWTVSGDVNGDGVADFELVVVVSDAHPLTSADFTL